MTSCPKIEAAKCKLLIFAGCVSPFAASVALATGQPDVAVVLTAPKGVGTAKLGASKAALMTATSAFGNSLTLPLVSPPAYCFYADGLPICQPLWALLVK
jgi:hypothetical protein